MIIVFYTIYHSGLYSTITPQPAQVDTTVIDNRCCDPQGAQSVSPLNHPGELVVREITVKTVNYQLHVFPRLRLPSNWLQLPAVKLL